MAHYQSLAYTNQFTFTCPIFDAKTKMGACTKLRDVHAKGKPLEIRRGCQAAMSCGMCPAAEMVRMYWQNKSWNNDHHGSVEPKEGKLHAQLLERVLRVMPQQAVLARYGVSDAERERLLSARERIAAQLKTAPGELIGRRDSDDYEAPKPRRKASSTPAKPASTNTINQAAATGDMSAAINA
jgi:hypothetical protein